MKFHFSLVPASVLLVAIFVPVHDAPAEKYHQEQLEGLTITMTLEKRTPECSENRLARRAHQPQLAISTSKWQDNLTNY